MQFGQVIVQLIINMSDLFVALLGKMKTSYRPFNDFDKIALVCDLGFFSQISLLFLIVSVLTLTRSKNHQLIKFDF